MHSLWHDAQRKGSRRRQPLRLLSPQLLCPVCRSPCPCPKRVHLLSRRGFRRRETSLPRGRIRFHQQQTRNRRKRPAYFARASANSPNSRGDSSRARLSTNGTLRSEEHTSEL